MHALTLHCHRCRGHNLAVARQDRAQMAPERSSSSAPASRFAADRHLHRRHSFPGQARWSASWTPRRPPASGAIAPQWKWEAGTRQRPFGKRLFSDRKLMMGAPFGCAGGKPHRKLSELRALIGLADHGCDVGRPDVISGWRFGAARGKRTGILVWLKASRYAL